MQLKKVGGLTALALVTTSAISANAASVLDANVLTQMDDTQTDIMAVGSALIALAVLVMAFRWVKAQFF